MTVLNIQPLRIAECVCLRPKLYTANGSLAEVVAFLLGYEAARNLKGFEADDSPSKVLDWLAKECGHDRSKEIGVPWLEHILARFQTEQRALDGACDYLSPERPRHLEDGDERVPDGSW